MKKESSPRFIYIAGCDGTGKSTQAKLLAEKLQAQDINPIHLWLRFPFFFSLPFLVYARSKKLSWSEDCSGVKHGYWEFQHSWVMRKLFPWFFLLDAAIASLRKVYLPLFAGKTIVCERYIIDMIADIEMGLNDNSFHKRLPGKLFIKLLPKESRTVILDLDELSARSRRDDLSTDKMLGKRLFIYRQLAKDFLLQTEDSRYPVEQVHYQIWKYIY